MQGRSHRLSDHGEFHRALIAFAYVVLVLLCGSSPTGLAGTDWLTRQIADRVEQIEVPNHTAVPMVRLDILFAEDLREEVVELAEPTDDDEANHCLLPLHVVLRLDVAACESQTGPYEWSADRVLTRFRLRAFPTRAPSA